MPWFRTRRLCCLAALLPVLAMPMTSRAQVESREGIALQNQLYQLRQDIQGLRADAARNGGGGGGYGGDVAAQLLSRVQAMEEQLRQLRGQIDETRNLANRHNADLSKRIDDLTFQLNLQGKAGGSSSSSSFPPMAPAPAVAPPLVREVAPRPMPEPIRIPEPARVPEPAPRIVMPLPSVIPPPPPPPPQSFTFNAAPEPMREIRQPPLPPTARIEPSRPAPVIAAPVVPPPVAPVVAAPVVAAPVVVAPVVPPPVARTPDPVPPQRPPVVVASAAPDLDPGGKRTPELALQEGHAALARRDYSAAERSAREVMGNRISPRAYDGQFLLAQSLAGQKQFAQAAIAFDDAYNRSHKGRHAQDALLGLAGALTAINEKRAACDTLGRLRTEFPQVRADLQDSITKTNERAGCGK